MVFSIRFLSSSGRGLLLSASSTDGGDSWTANTLTLDPASVEARDKLLDNNAFEDHRQLCANLILLAGRKYIDYAVDALSGIVRVQGREH